jgi:TrmH family RNA methyltransferase
VKQVRRLIAKRSVRRAEGMLVAEGAELVSVALDAGAPVAAVYLAPGARQDPAVDAVVVRAFAAGARVFDLAPGVLERVADTVSPQPVLAVVAYATTPLAAFESASYVVVCAGVRDPGNGGTVIRTADATGADGVVCCDGTVDVTNPKTVRASAGSLFHVPVADGGDPHEAVDALRTAGMAVVGTTLRGGVDYLSVDWTRRVAIVFGNEAGGLPVSLATACDTLVTIPMVGRAESLNVGVAAAVLGFEVLRQRRAVGPGRAGTPARVGGSVPGSVGTGDRSTMPQMSAGDRGTGNHDEVEPG